MTRIFDALRKSRTPRSGTPPVSPGERSGGPAASASTSLAPTYPLGTGVRTAHARTRAAVAGVQTATSSAHAPVRFAHAVDLSNEIVNAMTALRMGFESELTERLPRLVMFVSAQPGEGTSTIASQFATAVAREDRMRVLLVDVNARRPAWDADRGEAATVSAGCLDLLPLPESYRRSGSVPPDYLRDVSHAMAAAYDWIVVDGPSVLESPDGAPLAAAADGVVMVIEAGRAKRPVLSRAVDLLRKAGGRLLGSVLNRRRLEIPDFIYRRI